jgi:Rieske Fe-S protein
MTDGVTRRSALTAGAAAVVGGVAGFAYGDNSDATKAGKPGGGYGGGGSTTVSGKMITSLDKVPAGGGWIGSGVVVTRDPGGAVHAFSSTCTHLGCTVNKVSGGKIFCPCHGSVFNASTGAVVQGPASSPLPPVSVTVKDGEVYTA